MKFNLTRAVGKTIEGEALVSPVPFSARYDLDRVNGVISRIGHPLQGESIKGKIFLAPGVQGGVAAGWALLAMEARGVGFAGLVFGDTNPVMVQGAVTAGIPIASGLALEAFEQIKTGDYISLDPSTMELTVLESFRVE
ncbi:aconitase X swivel domain-containing protein [Arthrobacter sp. 35W]|uniref:aconitase X swivel domain-containing protein n=1 Tax=Arthrobacter sp. 35W TaxID=1132441 RepID=UPI000427D50C|nr:DUF126 domain-containing protein [Arthrobacter sp. 35W]